MSKGMRPTSRKVRVRHPVVGKRTVAEGAYRHPGWEKERLRKREALGSRAVPEMGKGVIARKRQALVFRAVQWRKIVRCGCVAEVVSTRFQGCGSRGGLPGRKKYGDRG